MKYLILLTSVVASSATFAADAVSLRSSVFVERTVTGTDGKAHVLRAAPKPVFPGDHLLFQLTYHNDGAKPAESFTVTNPIPPSVGFLSSDGGAKFSVDGGKSWGPLAVLKVADGKGTLRAAGAADITHVRWVLAKAIPAGGTGTLNFHAVVK